MHPILSSSRSRSPPPTRPRSRSTRRSPRRPGPTSISRSPGPTGRWPAWTSTRSWAGVLPRLDLSATLRKRLHRPERAEHLDPLQPHANPDGSISISYKYSLESVPANYVENYTLGLTLQVPIFDGMRNWATIARAKALLRAADQTYDEASLNVAFEVTRRFYEVVRAERSLKVLQEAVHAQRGAGAAHRRPLRGRPRPAKRHLRGARHARQRPHLRRAAARPASPTPGWRCRSRSAAAPTPTSGWSRPPPSTGPPSRSRRTSRPRGPGAAQAPPALGRRAADPGRRAGGPRRAGRLLARTSRRRPATTARGPTSPAPRASTETPPASTWPTSASS